MLFKLREYFGKESIHVQYQVKSKAAKVVDHRELAQPTQVAPPPEDMSMDDAMDVYNAEVSQFS